MRPRHRVRPPGRFALMRCPKQVTARALHYRSKRRSAHNPENSLPRFHPHLCQPRFSSGLRHPRTRCEPFGSSTAPKQVRRVERPRFRDRFAHSVSTAPIQRLEGTRGSHRDLCETSPAATSSHRPSRRLVSKLAILQLRFRFLLRFV